MMEEEPEIEDVLNALGSFRRHLDQRLDALMALTDDLKAQIDALTAVTTEVVGALDDLAAKATAAGSVSAADVQAAVDGIKQAVADIGAAVTKDDPSAAAVPPPVA